MKILLTRDSRRFNYQREFGSTAQFSPSLFVGNEETINDIEPIGSVMCVIYTVDKVKSGETGKIYDHTWLWTQMVQAGKVSSSGSNPNDGFALAVKGQKVVLTGEIDTSVGYFQAELGEYDFFTNVKSCIQNEYIRGFKRPIGCGTYWYSEWENVTVLSMGKTKISAHEWEIVGWDEEHPNCFKIDSHEGYYKYMPQDVFNAAMDATYGSVALTLSETTEEQIQALKAIKVSLIKRLLDWCYNTVKILTTKLETIQPSVLNQPSMSSKPPVVEQPKINLWANLIAKFEGANPTLNNPGNFGYTYFMATAFGAHPGPTKSDGGRFCQFDTPQKGFNALTGFLTLACKDQLKAYHNARTIKEFTLVYTNHPKPQFDYSDALIKDLGVTADTLISTFL